MKQETFPIPADFANPFEHPSLRDANVFELIKDLVRPSVRPFDCLQVEVTSCCTAKCTYCPHTTKSTQWNSRHMQAHTFVNAWPLLKKTTRVHLQGWGEPLLHPHFFDFVALARKAGCLVSSTSCGLHIDTDLAQKIVQSGMDIIAFSLAGTDHKSNSARAGANFEQVCNNIKLLQTVRKEKLGAHLEIHLAYILLADRLEAVKELPKLMNELDVHASIVSTLDYLAHDSQAKLAINPQDFHVIDKAKHILEQAAHDAKQSGRQIYYALPSIHPSPECRENIQKSLYIDADGNIAPCIYLNVPDREAFKIIFGNINLEHPLHIWDRANFMEFRKSHIDNNPIKQCQECVKKFETLK